MHFQHSKTMASILFLVFSHSSCTSIKSNFVSKNEAKIEFLDAKKNASKIGSIEWVQSLYNTYPELSWLVDSKVVITQEGRSSDKTSWSKKIWGIHYEEFERTILSLAILEWIADGSQEAYSELTQSQPESQKLTYPSFQKLHTFLQNIIAKDPMKRMELIRINLILGDLGKTHIARQLAHDSGLLNLESDHDKFLSQCLSQNIPIFPTYEKLDDSSKITLKEIHGLVHFGHVSHLENDIQQMLNPLKDFFKKHSTALDFNIEIISHICDVGAARGHQNNLGSWTLVQKTYDILNLVMESLLLLNVKNEKEVLKHYLSERAKWLNIGDHLPEKEILTRLGCMLRFTTPEEGEMLIKTWKQLDSNTQNLILNPFSLFNHSHSNTIITYGPTLFINALESFPGQKEKGIQFILKFALPFYLKTLQKWENIGIKSNELKVINFNLAAGQIKKNLNLLREVDSGWIDKEGNVSFFESK